MCIYSIEYLTTDWPLLTSRAPSTETVTATHKSHERLPEVGGTGAVEEKSRREIAIVEELDELLPDVRVQRHVVRLVAQADDERVDTEGVAGQVEGDEDGGDDQQRLGDAQLSLMASGEHAPRPGRRNRRARRRRRNGAVAGRRGPRGWAAQPSRRRSAAPDTRYVQPMTLRSPSNRGSTITSSRIETEVAHLILLQRGTVGILVVGRVGCGGCYCSSSSRRCSDRWRGCAVDRTTSVLADLDAYSGVHDEDDGHWDDHDN